MRACAYVQARAREGVLHATIKPPRFIRLSDKSGREDGPDGACRYDLPALMPHLHARGLYSPMLQARTPRRSAAAQRSGAPSLSHAFTACGHAHRRSGPIGSRARARGERERQGGEERRVGEGGEPT